jgi:hypothetical protein
MHYDDLTVKLANGIVSSWNGKDSKFLHNGTVYSHRDVQLARYYLNNQKT